VPQRVHQPGEIPRQEHGRGAPAPMHVHHSVAFAQMPADESDLAFEQIGVGCYRSIFARHGGVATAVKAELGTKGYV